MKLLLLLCLTSLSIPFGAAAMNKEGMLPQGKDLEYTNAANIFQGYLVYPKKVNAQTDAILIIHDWMSITDRTKAVANKLAQLGHIAFAADIYGKGLRPSNAEEAAGFAKKFKSDRALFRTNLVLALETLLKQKGVRPERVAAIGYCFGGTGAMELARTGANIKGVISFHGGLDSPNKEDGKMIKAKVLALHGADDPFVPASDLAAFEQELKDAKVDYQIVKFGGAVHSFTDKSAGDDPSKGAAYNAKADSRSWEMMKSFLKEIF